ncbi:MAG TPA: hypothetical protein PLJ57_07585 [Tepidanaerobacteraceae bacterium]|nr:hypothetical protein [Tepidanaerobacteraceae bacterium]
MENTVIKLCNYLHDKLCFNIPKDELSLRRELVACILSSQVRYEMARMALECIEASGLLSDDWWGSRDNKFEIQVYRILASLGYRFPKIRAFQLNKARNAIVNKSLLVMICNGEEPKDIRKYLVNEFSGLGPKQASMFLRNIGISNDLAILDNHVIRYMRLQNLLYNNRYNTSTLPAYERVEKIIIDYADKLGFPVGCLDLAIWATMRAARELRI